MLTSLLGSVPRNVVETNIAVAYVTTAGVVALMGRLSATLGPSWTVMPKFLIASLDGGVTEPRALDLLVDVHGFEVRVSRSALPANKFRPSWLFHPKVFAFGDGMIWSTLIGSANLTKRGLSVNAEAGSIGDLTSAEWGPVWARLWDDAVPWNDDIRVDYVAWRTKLPPRPTSEDKIPVPTGTAIPALTLLDALGRGFSPGSYDHMWVDVGYVSGGSGNQVEIPRGSVGFFGVAEPSYGAAHEQLVLIDIQAPGQGPVECLVSWHGGNNKMLRINLPTAASGGEVYAYRTILLERTPEGAYNLTVEDSGTDMEQSWKAASDTAAARFLVGRTVRQVGFY